MGIFLDGGDVVLFKGTAVAGGSEKFFGDIDFCDKKHKIVFTVHGWISNRSPASQSLLFLNTLAYRLAGELHL